jgi:hypothetical protein
MAELHLGRSELSAGSDSASARPTHAARAEAEPKFGLGALSVRCSVLGFLSSVFGLRSSVFCSRPWLARRQTRRIVVALILWLGGTVGLQAASFDELFLYGCRAYAAAGYNQASELFEEALKLGLAPGLLHNLGNAHWQCGRVGPAILAWEQAQWLDSYNRNTRANLRFARKTMQLDMPELAWYEVCSTWLPVNAWAVLAGVSLWVGLGAVWLPGILRWRRADWHQAVAAAGLAVFLLTVPAMIGVHTRSKLAVILQPQTPLRLTPTKEAQILAKLPAGDVVRIERQRGSYLYVRAGNDAAGWVQQTQLGRICAR